jgi:hypothetical protein
MSNGANFNELFEKESSTMAPRPYISVGATLLMFIGFACLLYPLCDVLTVIGLPSAPCLLIITFGAFFAALCTATFWMFLLWSCTRTYAALVFLFISLTGQILLPTGNPILLLVWVLVAFGGGYLYFYYLPDSYKVWPPSHSSPHTMHGAFHCDSLRTACTRHDDVPARFALLPLSLSLSLSLSFLSAQSISPCIPHLRKSLAWIQGEDATAALFSLRMASPPTSH